MKKIEQDILISDLIYKKLRGVLKGNEADILEAWLQKPENMRFFVELKNSDSLYQGVEKLKCMDEQLAWGQMGVKMAKVRHRRWRYRFCSIAALVVVGIFYLWLWQMITDFEEVRSSAVVDPWMSVTVWRMEDKEIQLADTLREFVLPQETKREPSDRGIASEAELHYEEFITAQTDRLQVILSDGTRVWLNGGSRLKYPSRFAVNCREVELLGEAYFEVARDSARPFRVHTALAMVEVLGTAFNVSVREEQGCITTLVEGKVRMEDKDAHVVMLAPGQQAVLDEKGGWKVEEVDVRYFTAWKDGLFAFKDVKLEIILDKLSRYYGVKFEFENSEVASLTYTTIIKQYENVEDVLLILEKVGDFSCKQIGKNLFVVQKK